MRIVGLVGGIMVLALRMLMIMPTD
jgi:hypothetical protein